jgi:hypothetical protein
MEINARNKKVHFLQPRRPGLPDGMFSNQKSKFGKIFEGLGMKKNGIFYGHLEYIMAILYSLWPFGNLVAVWYISPRFGIKNKEKSGNPTWRIKQRRFVSTAKQDDQMSL